VRKFVFAAACLFALPIVPVSSFAEPPGLSTPSRSEMESAIGGMGLSMGEKLSLRKILQTMQEQGDAVRADAALSDQQKSAQIVKIRQSALDQTSKILNDSQQKQMEALLLPKS